MGQPLTTPGLYGMSPNQPNAGRMTGSMERSSNEHTNFVFMGNANIGHVPQFFVGIFNVGDMEHKIERPWVNYNPAQHGKMIVIPACESGLRYCKPFLIADIVQEPVRNIYNGQMDSRGVDGKFLAQDAINPEDPKGNWKTVRPMNAGQAMNIGTNLYNWGVFWETIQKPTDAPSDAAITKAHERLEAFYNYLIDEAKSLYMQGDEGRRQISNTHRRAASFFGLEFEWNQLYKRRIDCAGCGGKIPQGVALCGTCGAVQDWQKALSLGLKTPAEAIAAGFLPSQAEEMAEKGKRKSS